LQHTQRHIQRYLLLTHNWEVIQLLAY
jgi:hypothetical protein